MTSALKGKLPAGLCLIIIGTEGTVESSQPASGFVPKVGEIIPVRYYIDNPGWVQPAFSWWTLWAGAILFSGIGLFFITLIGIVFFIIRRADAARRSEP